MLDVQAKGLSSINRSTKIIIIIIKFRYGVTLAIPVSQKQRQVDSYDLLDSLAKLVSSRPTRGPISITTKKCGQGLRNVTQGCP